MRRWPAGEVGGKKICPSRLWLGPAEMRTWSIQLLWLCSPTLGKPKSFPILKYQVTHCAWDCCALYVLCTGYPWPGQRMLAQACVIPGTAPQPLLLAPGCEDSVYFIATSWGFLCFYLTCSGLCSHQR